MNQRLEPGFWSGARVWAKGLMAAWVALPFLAASPLEAAPPKVVGFSPSGARLGEHTTVVVEGTLGHWPVQAWVDRPGPKITAGEKKGELLVELPEDASPGVYWVRLIDEEGASAPRPLIVESLSELTETEPNDERGQAQAVTLPAVVTGQLAKNGDVDGFAVELSAGQKLIASVLSRRVLNSPLDCVLQIVTPDGFILAQNDEYHGYDPQIVYEAPRDGTYIVRLFAFPVTPDTGIRLFGAAGAYYRLTLTTGPFVEYALADEGDAANLRLHGWNLSAADTLLARDRVQPGGVEQLAWVRGLAGQFRVGPLSHDDDATLPPAARKEDDDQARVHALPLRVAGRITQPGEMHAYRFTAKKNETWDFALVSQALDFPIDGQLTIRDADGKQLARNDDLTRQQRDAGLSFKAPADGEYVVQVEDMFRNGGERHVYWLSIARPQPDYALTVDADFFELAAGKPLEITVNVNRIKGYSGEVEITAEGLPPGVTVKPAVSEGKGDSAKSVKLTLTRDAAPAAESAAKDGEADKPEEAEKPGAEKSDEAAKPAAGGGAFRIVGRSRGEEVVERPGYVTSLAGAGFGEFWLHAKP